LTALGEYTESLTRRAPFASPDSVVRNYDFRRPDKLNKDHLRSIRVLHEAFVRLLASYLTSYVRTTVQVRLANVEQVPYEDYIDSLPRPTIIYVMTLAPLPGQAVVQIDLPLARAILDRLLGGLGNPDDRGGELTEIEMALLNTLAGSIRSSLAEVWDPIMPVQVSITDPVLNSEFVQVALPTETTAVIGLEVDLGNIGGIVTLCFPHPVLQPVLDTLTAELRFSTSVKEETDTSHDLLEQMNGVVVPVVAELGRANITLRDLLNLSPGRIIKLDVSANAHLPIRIDDVVKFSGKPGVQGRNMAVQISDILH